MNNLEIIKDFIENESKTKLLVNQVNDEVGLFYLHVFENYAQKKNIKLIYQDQLVKKNRIIYL